MALNPQTKGLLDKFTQVAKKIIYNPDRMQQFMQMLGTPEGAITAVQSVISAIEKKMPVPPEIQPLLAVNCYMAMVDVAQEGTKVKADKEVMEQVIASILSKMTAQPDDAEQPGQPEEPDAMPPEQQQQPQSLLASMQGAPA